MIDEGQSDDRRPHHDSAGDAEYDPLDTFLANAFITEVLGEIKSGKEGTVYLCRAHPSTGHDLLAAKVYRSASHRTFKNDSAYREGRVILDQRNARAARKNTAWGRTVRFSGWIEHEYQTLLALSEAGADVPEPITRTADAILMRFVGDERGAAPSLQGTALHPDEARRLFTRLMNNVELFLHENRIHGDLSAYNILYHRGEAIIIDFPQTVDARANPNALRLLERDLENLCRYFARYGIQSDPERMTHFLWGRFLRAEL